jgi:ubiquinone/menaquinone biosynthesis C-methylase UbiE
MISRFSQKPGTRPPLRGFVRKPARKFEKSVDTSWHAETKDYNKIVGEDGHYFHQHVVIPGVLRLLNLKRGDSLLDLGCGQGVLARAIPTGVNYLGVDAAAGLIDVAKKMDHEPNHKYITASATRQLQLSESFTSAAIVLALQNMELPQNAIKNASQLLVKDGKLAIVINHPMFRIPRQSGWGEHPNKLQYRYVNRYLSFMKIPILMHPSRKGGAETVSYHFPLSYYVDALVKNGFVITAIEEWTSDKESKGKAAKQENRARTEIPLFMAILAQKR